MDTFCGSPFWNKTLSWDTTNHPDFTPCFQETALVWVPCAFLWIFSLVEIYKIRQAGMKNVGRLPWTLVSAIKILLSVSLSVISTAEMVHGMVKHFTKDAFPVEYYTPFVKAITFTYVAVLLSFHRKRAINSSAVLFLFWLLMSLSSGWTCYSVIRDLLDENSFLWNLDRTLYILKIVGFPLVFAELILSFFTDELPLRYISPGQEFQNASPEWSASFISRVTFWWMNQLIILGFKRPLKADDLYDLQPEHKTERVFKDFSRRLTPKSGLIWPLFLTFGPTLFLTAFFKLISVLLIFVNPIVLDWLLVWMQTRTPYWHGFFFAGIMFISSTLDSMFTNQYEYRLNIVAMQMRSALTDAIYQKALRLSPAAKTTFSTGQIINLMSVDSQRVIQFIMFFNYFWVSPLQIGIAIFLLWQQLGASTLAGVAVLLFLIPLNGYVTSRLRATQEKLMKAKDTRSKLLNEILSGIKVLKLYGWEPSFGEQVKKVRSKEIANLKLQSYSMSAITFTLSCALILVALASFATYILVDSTHNLDPSKAFVSLTLFNIIRLPLTFLPLLITFGTMFVVAMRRIEKYLNGEESDFEAVSKEVMPEGQAIKISNSSFSWEHHQLESTLKDMNLNVSKGELVAIVGKVGTGKSSLLCSMLGDMIKDKGSVNIDGTLAYVPQQAWIQNATLKQNVIFTSAYDDTKYHRIIDACALVSDIKILAAGDNTEIGEKGINLSGGQKQRVSLARAVYSDADVYLLDDPLSAVDSMVGKHLFEKVLGPGGLLRKKTRVLVTQKISLLPKVDRIVVMSDGQISEQGTYQELIDQKGAFSEFILEYLEGVVDEDDDELAEIKEQMRPELERHLSKKSGELSSSVDSNASRMRKLSSVASEDRRRTSSVHSREKEKVANGTGSVKPTTGKLVEAETEGVGGVSRKVYWSYISAMGWLSFSAVIFFMTVSSGVNIFSSLWLSYWADDALNPQKANDTALRDRRVMIYGVLGVSESVLTFFSNFYIFSMVLNAGSLIHNLMLESILRAPMSFFDTTPIGRILNRFTKDIDSLDILLAYIRQFLGGIYRTGVTLILISLQSPAFLIVALPLSIIYYIVQRYYIASSRQMKRIESTTRSPIYSHFSETVTGSSSIRAFGVVDSFISECENLVDRNAKSYLLSSAANLWLGVRLEFIGNVIVLTSALFAVTGIGSSNPALAGLSISYALTVTQTLNMVVRASVDLENNLVSVERCIEYTKIPPEANWYNEATKPKRTWPDEGIIQFDNYSTRYREGLDLVLRRMSFESKPSEKIGVVGRTGAGKSSLTLALFRLVEPVNGSIIIDNIDISRLGLMDVRSRLSIIPQDPVLFTGTLRINLDPFETYTDNEIWDALQFAHLKDFVSSSEGGLEMKIAEGGENLSVGQRQLVCLARALLRKSKILVLDEATASVDVETDDLIQKTIRTQFARCTIITIAHRLNTIIDYDRILVLDQGELAEFDAPTNLLSNPESKFYSMARAAGLIASSGGTEGDNAE